MAIIGISGKKQSGKDLAGWIIQYLIYCKENEGRKDFDYPFNDFIRELDNGYVSDKYPLITTPKWVIHKFADKVKDIVCLLIGCTREDLENEDFKNTKLGEEWDCIKVQLQDYDPFGAKYYYNKLFTFKEEFDNWYKTKSDSELYIKDTSIKLTPRKLLQLVGTNCGRNIIHPNIWINSTFNGYDSTERFRKIDKDADYKYPNYIITDVRFPNEVKAIEDRGGFNIRVLRKGEIYETDKSKTAMEIGINKHEELESFIKGTHESETALDNYKFKYFVSNHTTKENLMKQLKQILEEEGII